MFGKNIADLFHGINALYKTDLKTYAKRNGMQNVPGSMLPPNAFAIWNKLLWAWAESEDPHLDLRALTIEDIETGGEKIATVANAINNGLLKRIGKYDDLTATL
ncbi:MAG: hypothetical protein Q8M98_07200 [Candidatus Cloacimonadaceae bacterium]|nr:hypothetical protein [Candidatus Cloacimonadaceae bacterium]MDP3114548.1 hypothetical protein [Candidatus Cloacimonadaceae bacterium]